MIASVIRQQGTYKKRTDGTKRVFGGLNVVLCGDFWQLHPVSGTFLCSNPIDIPAGRARNALNLFWDEGQDTIRSYWPLTEVMRCRDPWYRDFLQECRKGSLSCEMYCFFFMACQPLLLRMASVLATTTYTTIPSWGRTSRAGATLFVTVAWTWRPT